MSFRLEFSDGTSREIDLEPYLTGEIFEPIRNDKSKFRSVSVKDGSRTIGWENGADIDPYTLYLGIVPEWSEEDEDLAELLKVWKARRECGEIPGVPVDNTTKELGLR